MVLAKNIVDRLKVLCYDNELLKIKGFNDIGEEFETSGRIAFDDNYKPGITENALWIDFGRKNSIDYSFQTMWTTNFIFDLPESISMEGSCLFVDEVLTEYGEIVVKNQDAEKLRKFVNKRKINYENKLKEENRLTNKEELDPASESIRILLGNPFILKDSEYVYYGVVSSIPKCATDEGDMWFTFKVGDRIVGIYIKKDSEVYIPNIETDEIYLVEDNNDYKDIDQKFIDRASKIQKQKI